MSQVTVLHALHRDVDSVGILEPTQEYDENFRVLVTR